VKAQRAQEADGLGVTRIDEIEEAVWVGLQHERHDEARGAEEGLGVLVDEGAGEKPEVAHFRPIRAREGSDAAHGEDALLRDE
jgi:hypothetical protein